MSMSMLKSGSFQMTQTSEQLMPLPALPPGGTTGNQIQSNPNRNSFLQGASLDFKLATLRNEMVSRYFLTELLKIRQSSI